MSIAHFPVTVEGLTQESGEEIKKTLERINGVDSVMVNIENKKLFIEYDDEKIDERIIKETIEDEGYNIK